VQLFATDLDEMAIFENAREYAIFSVDRERRVISWNIGAERLLGLAKAKFSDPRMT
jgi:PAS domain-containing protein